VKTQWYGTVVVSGAQWRGPGVGLVLLLIGAIGAHARSHNHNGEERSAAADVGHISGGRYARDPDTRMAPPKTAID
jgi:hypothetical protein